LSDTVFISYASKDKEVADAVVQALEKSGVRCWIAPRDILPGVPYASAIIDALNTCQVFLVILSETSNSSSQVAREVERAISKDRTILTLRIDTTPLSKVMEYYLSDRHWMDASGGINPHQLSGLAKVVKSLESALPSHPEEISLQKKKEPIEKEKEKEQLEELLSKAEATIKSARWEQAIELLEAALAINPDETVRAKLEKVRAQQQAAWLSEQEKRASEPAGTAQILPTAQTNSSIPLWRKRRVYGALGAVAIIALGVLFGPKLLAAISAPLQPTNTLVKNGLPTSTTLATFTALPVELVSLQPILTYINSKPPDFMDDFSKDNNSWDPFMDGVARKNGALSIVLETGKPSQKIGIGSPYLISNNFGLAVDILFKGSSGGAIFDVGFPTNGNALGVNCDASLDLARQEWSIGLTDQSIEKKGSFEKPLKDLWLHVELVYFNGQEVGFLDGEMLGHITGIQKSGDLFIVAVNEEGGIAEIWLDNIKFWNLDGIPIAP
jgi:hypothetical protein